MSKNEFLVKFYFILIGYTFLWVTQNLGNDLKSILGFLDVFRTFGPAKLVSAKGKQMAGLFEKTPKRKHFTP